MQPILSIKDLGKSYQEKNRPVNQVIDQLSLELTSGEFVGIMGSSGSGKSTLLNLIATIDFPTEGEIQIDGTRLSSLSETELALFRGRDLGFVFQEYNLLNTLTLFENISLPLIMHKMQKPQIEKEVAWIAEKLQITDCLERYPYEVSGGQRQRCACARALVKKPKLLLADEPTGALDSKSACSFLNLLSQLNSALKTTILMVTHDAVSASYCDKVLFLRDGRIYHECKKSGQAKKQFFHEILDILSVWEDCDNVC